MMDPLSYFSFQPVLHDWRNKGRGMHKGAQTVRQEGDFR